MEVSRGGILARIALVLVSAGVGLLAAEGLARLTWPDPPPPPMEAHGDLPVLAGLMDLARPNVRGIDRGVYYRTNSRGLRGPEWTREPAPGVFRIAIAGDSTTMGSGVEEDARYSNQLEHRLNQLAPERSYEVINTGLSGLNIQQGVDRLERNLHHYRVDLMVFGFSPNDIEGEAYEQFDRSDRVVDLWKWASSQTQSRLYLWRWITYRIFDFSTRGARGRKFQEIRYNYLENAAAWKDFLEGLDRFADLAREHGVCGHVLLHTLLDELSSDHPYTDIYRLVEEAARERSLTTTQSFPHFQGLRPEPLWVSVFDPHPNREGHAILVDALVSDLKKLPPGCWKGKSPWYPPTQVRGDSA